MAPYLKCLVCSVKISSRPAVSLLLRPLIARFSSFSEIILASVDDCDPFFLFILEQFFHLFFGFSRSVLPFRSSWWVTWFTVTVLVLWDILGSPSNLLIRSHVFCCCVSCRSECYYTHFVLAIVCMGRSPFSEISALKGFLLRSSLYFSKSSDC